MLKIAFSACLMYPDPQRKLFSTRRLLYAEEGALHWLIEHGAFPVLVPTTPTEFSVQELVNDLDGLYLQGGADIDPKEYGETPQHPDWAGDPDRDAYELRVLRAFIEAKKPILGICRGSQLINVAFGGSLYQDIPSMISEKVRHRDQERYERNHHEIVFEEAGYLSSLYNRPGGQIVSVHHQSVKLLGKNLKVEARCPEDGVIEAIKLSSPDNHWVLGLQWHPEFRSKNDAHILDSSPVIQAFLNACKNYRNQQE